MRRSFEFIAEVKTQSPFGFRSQKSWEELFQRANRAGDIISVHTDPRWGGSIELLARARRLTRKPLLAKGIHETDESVKRAVEAGADWVLVVGRMPMVYRQKCVIEPLTLAELRRIPETVRVVWNSRDLKTGRRKKETFAEARKIFRSWLCQASNIRTIADIEPGADAVLVGEHLAEFSESLKR